MPEPEPVKHFFELFCWVTAKEEERVSVLRLAFEETVTLMRQTLRCGNRRYQMNCSHSSSSQRKWDEALAEPVIYSLLKVFVPSLVDTLFSSCAFSPLIPKAVCQGALMAFLSLSQPLLLLFFSRSGVEWNGKERNKFVLAWTVWRMSIILFSLILAHSHKCSRSDHR